jgi:putative endonuclease
VLSGTNRRHALGLLGEDLAARHLERIGLEILARRARTSAGEIDLVAFGEDAIVFAEVKARRIGTVAPAAPYTPEPLIAIGMRKRARLRRAAAAWLAEQPVRPRARRIRFDAVAVVIDARDRVCSIEHVSDAF